MKRLVILLLALTLAGPAAAQGTRLGGDTGPIRAADGRVTSATAVFDGVLVNAAFIERIAEDPVMSWSVAAGKEGALLTLVVQKPRAVLALTLVEPSARPTPRPARSVTGGQALSEYGGYRVLARARSTLALDMSGEDWPFYDVDAGVFGDGGPWGEVTTVLRQPGSRVPPITLTHQFSWPTGSEGWRHETWATDAQGAELARSNGIRIASSSTTAPQGQANQVAFCDTLADQQARIAVSDWTDGATQVGDSVAIESGPRSLSASGVFRGEGSSVPVLGPAIDAAAAAVYQAAALGNYVQCLDEHGILSAELGLDGWLPTGFDPVYNPPQGLQLVVTCVRWSEEWEEAFDTEEGIEVVFHHARCLKLEFQWL